MLSQLSWHQSMLAILLNFIIRKYYSYEMLVLFLTFQHIFLLIEYQLFWVARICFHGFKFMSEITISIISENSRGQKLVETLWKWTTSVQFCWKYFRYQFPTAIWDQDKIPLLRDKANFVRILILQTFDEKK